MIVITDFDGFYRDEKMNMDLSMGTNVTLGKFDGIHRGHKRLMKEITENKGEIRKSVVICFGKTPYRILEDCSKKVLTTSAERRFLLEKMGIDVLLELPFTKELKSMRAIDFVQSVLVDSLHCRYVTVGSDFGFGKNREGNAQALGHLGVSHGFLTKVFPKEQDGGEDISSSRISACLEKGDITMANRLLGHDYFLLGNVDHGNHIGTGLGFPTINLGFEGDKLLPPDGVYVSSVYFPDTGRSFSSITNIGIRPTFFDKAERTVETNLFDFNEDLYGRQVILRLHEFIRSERKFEKKEDLISQINQDIRIARSFVHE